MHCLSRLICIALLALWTAQAAQAAHTGDPFHSANPADIAHSSHTADVDIDDVPVGRALRLLAEIYDVSIVTGQLPETRVTVRLRAVSAREAFESLAVAAGLTVVVEGAIVRVSPKSSEPTVRQIVQGPFPEGAEAGLTELRGAGVEVRRMDDGSFLLEGAKSAVEAAAAALGSARQHLLVERVFHLGVASGEETQKAVVPLLEPHLEVASYDANGHLLTVSALPATIARIESLLAELTRPPAQFEIEVRVVEVSRTALEQLGAQGSFGLDVSGGVLATTFPLSGLQSARRYLPSASDLATLRSLGGAGSGSTSGTGTGTFSDSGFRFGRIDGTGIRLLIQALEQSGEARVVATPKVTALDNHRAKISMVTTLRIPTFTQNQAFATTTVSGIEQIDVGTTLEVLPRKGEGRQILLKVIPEVSELSPQVETFTQSGLTQGLPIVTRRRTDTEVILGGGETLVIGGLVTERESKTKGKTPGLADIPWIGRAFRLEGKSAESSELLVFVTPRELPSPEERRTRARVDDSWIPNGLAAQVDAARAQIHARQPADRLAGVSTLEQIDRDLLAAGVDVGRDVAGLGTDASLEVRVAAALFLLHERPANALGELVRFADSRAVALSALAAPMAPHLRAALAELLGQSAGGAEALAHQLDVALDGALAAGDSAAAFHLGEALCVAAPALAAERAARIGDLARQAGDSLGAETLRLDALSGAPGSAAELAARAVDAPSPEVRSFALAGLVRSLGSRGTAELLAGRSPVALPAPLVARVRTLAPATPAGSATPTPPASPETEPALGWSGAPSEIVLRGDAAGSALVREALDLLARRAPDLRHLVGFGLATIEAGAPSPGVDPAVRSARVTAGGDRDLTPERLALQLVRLATLVFESRVRGFPTRSDRNLARAVREEIHALERLTGAPCSPQRAASTVGQVLAAARSGEGPAHESAGAVGGGR
ncbi:MAG TPA: hypothetical protein VFE33_11355 [Thermoanaerobaculia bacterium]|nr:hypothetical protein [Thermoanaerobaculia bacterium]